MLKILFLQLSLTLFKNITKLNSKLLLRVEKNAATSDHLFYIIFVSINYTMKQRKNQSL